VKQIHMSMATIETPADLEHGEVVEAIRLGGPKDGDTIGFYRVELGGRGEITLHPLQVTKN